MAQWADFMGYEAHYFDAVDQHGVAIYHSNVMMSVGSGFAAVALDAIPDSAERERLRQSLEIAGKEVIPLSLEQIAGFGANILHLSGSVGELIAMSEAARSSLGAEVTRRLESHGNIVSAPIPTIEQCGGGSVRCMLAEIFLPLY